MSVANGPMGTPMYERGLLTMSTPGYSHTGNLGPVTCAQDR